MGLRAAAADVTGLDAPSDARLRPPRKLTRLGNYLRGKGQYVRDEASKGTPDLDSERRRHERFAVRCDCWLERDEATIYGTTADLGMGGLFLRTAVPVPHGYRVDIELNIAGASTINARGTVTRAIPAQHGCRHGIGVEFDEIKEGGEQLRRFLRTGTP